MYEDLLERNDTLIANTNLFFDECSTVLGAEFFEYDNLRFEKRCVCYLLDSWTKNA